MNNVPDDLHPRLKKLFASAFAKGMSLRQIGRLAGISQNLPCIWLRGGTTPIIGKLEAAEKAVRAYKPKNPPCIVERMFQECGINVQFVDVKEAK